MRQDYIVENLGLLIARVNHLAQLDASHGSNAKRDSERLAIVWVLQVLGSRFADELKEARRIDARRERGAF